MSWLVWSTLLVSLVAANSDSVQELFNLLSLQQESIEESVRTNGHSGIKQIRQYYEGTKPYYSAHHTSESTAAFHNHGNHIRTMGMGEVTAVLNGIEFRTRHNDFRLEMPSTSSSDLHAVQEIPFPPLPPSVLDKSVDDQVKEMTEYFRAFKQQDSSIREYKPYFKPVLCYLEGAWFDPGNVELDGFMSFRHHVEADSWNDLHEQVAFTSYSGRKQPNENLSHLPKKILRLVEGSPVTAQFNFRIVCHPLTRDVPLNRLKVVDNLAVRATRNQTLTQYTNSRSARFRLNGQDSDIWEDGITTGISFLDQLMSEIPGKNNYGAQFSDNSFGYQTLDISSTEDNVEALNTGMYHRWYKSTKGGMMNSMGMTEMMGMSEMMGMMMNAKNEKRGYNDDSIYMAMTDHPEIVGQTLRQCSDQGDCEEIEQKWTYAIPLEIIYLTPLTAWNPLGTVYKGTPDSAEGAYVTAQGRNGESMENAFNGTSTHNFYTIPDSFFTSDELEPTAADTGLRKFYVMNENGDVSLNRPGGHRIILPAIGDVGIVRQRYPIYPVYEEGSLSWKEIERLKELI